MQSTEQLIIQAALKLFSQKGYEATSIRDIADEVEIKSATLYYYVKTKKDILNKIMDNYLNQLISKAEEGTEHVEDPVKRLEQLIKIHVTNHGKERLAALVVDHEYRSLEGEDRVLVGKLRKQYEEMWLNTIKEGQAQGVFQVDDAKITSFALIGLCTEVVNWYQEGGRKSIQEIADLYVTYGLKLVGIQN